MHDLLSQYERFKGSYGTVKGAAQNSCRFVWVCSYRFEGETEQVKNGSIIFQTLGVIVMINIIKVTINLSKINGCNSV